MKGLHVCLLLLFPTLAFSLPQQISPPGERMVLVSPREHAWGAYDQDGRLIRSGLASAGADWCADIGRECHTNVGSFRVRAKGGPGCVSPSYPLGKDGQPKGGAPMNYCMYFTPYQALHGSNNVRYANISHGCVRMHVADAAWLSRNFVSIGTLVVVEPY